MIRKCSVTLNGHRTSFSLEEEFHAELRGIALARGLSLAGLIAEVDEGREEGDNLSSALRVYVLKAVKARPLGDGKDG
ncbi:MULTISPECIES: ribbon-helix-helix domain-containing protein [unclassified Rhizobium]|uniref:ribbon-helix-helix domain-containing protein n=1 Tax=unclassified Rhizobium TaxID=2613769 RepID=UPI0016019080|nr:MULTISPECIES: ribbon-helix-helix domain-containing protein [unclassified Rhizobium]MBB1250706.1 ribbon-helix-helix domain-containing protein [Rhizobium sp. G21]MCV3764550.1 ribbon-helix-helix domain-containing protein [Rhizobium sp. TRM95796]